MKKTFLFLFLLVLTVALFAGGGEGEAVGKNYDLVVMNNGILKFPDAEATFRTAPGIIEKLADDFMAANPNVKVSFVYRDVSTGSLTYDTMLAAGNPPDIWIDASGYFVDLMNADYSIALEQYLDLSKYKEDLLNLYKRDGHQYALPLVNIATGMAVNLTMLREAGLELPPIEKWTTDNFLKGAAALKKIGYPATMIMGQGGLNGWTDVWFYAFGASMFNGSDYSKVTINSPEALKALAFMQTLIDSGYTPPPLTINDDAGVELFCTNKVFSCMMQNGHVDPRFPVELEKGNIDFIPDYTFVEFPHAPGRDHTPVSGYQTIINAHKSGDAAKDAVIAELTGLLCGEEAQYYYAIMSGGFPTIKGLEPNVGMAATPSYQAIAKLASTAGVYKEWPDGPIRSEVRRIWNTYTEAWLRGKLSAADMLAQYEREANAKIKELAR